jgi:hypothetical protein
MGSLRHFTVTLALIAISLGASPGSLRAQDEALVRVSAQWRYLIGTNEPGPTALAWTQTAFDDNRWSFGPSGFGLITTDDATLCPEMLGASTSLYLRKSFVVADPESITWLVLRIDYQDGFVAYLNGHEVARSGLDGLPGIRVPANATASAHVRGNAELFDLTAFKHWLIPGTNCLALQAVNASVYSYGFSVVPELLVDFVRGPFLQCMSTNQVLVVWRTITPGDSAVEFGPTPELGSMVASTNNVQEHAILLANLEPNCRYWYRVRTSAQGQTARSGVASFKTFSTGGPLKFVVVADSGNGSVPQFRIAQIMQDLKPDFVMHLGDLVYPAFLAGQMDQKFFSINHRLFRQAPFFYALGNHDRYGNLTGVFDEFYLPTNSATGTDIFYSFDHGDAHFAVLDTDLQARADYSPGSVQYQWLEQDLARTDKPWKILCFHHSIRSSGVHRHDDYNYNGIDDRLELQNSIGQLAAKYHVPVILTAHEHLYERFNPVDGVYIVMTGGGGGGLYPFGGTWDEASCQFWGYYNCVEISVDGPQLALRAITTDGTVFDRMFMRLSPEPPQVYPSTWHTPQLTGVKSDDDGNELFQRYDFIGRPIPAVAGERANLGRFYVNNDAASIYLGFEQMMLCSNQCVFAFVESPGLRGCTNLASLGNRRLDPDDQGVDGLDVLNVGFTNLAPSVVVILGDEFADGQYRSFQRPGAAMNTGQGVFYLTPGFPDVPGVAVQQFNRTPQIYPALGEQNSDFAGVTIPLAALGLNRPVGRLRIGAMVASFTMLDTNGPPIVALDRGFLGRSWAGGDRSSGKLEGVEVELARANGARLELWFEVVIPGTSGRIWWSSIPAQEYWLETADQPEGPYHPIDNDPRPILAEGGVCSHLIKLGEPNQSQPSRFYRVRMMNN